MSHFPPESLGFYDTVQLFFMELTGRAILFSGRDLELLTRWREQGASAAVVCRGLREAIEALGPDDPPRDIYNCRAYIEPLVELAREKATGTHVVEPPTTPPPASQPPAPQPSAPQPAPAQSTATAPGRSDEALRLYDRALEVIERAGARCEDEALRHVYRRAWRQVHTLRTTAADSDEVAYEELAALERALADGFFAALEAAEQQRIEALVARENERLVARMSPDARREHLLARKRLLLIREYGLARLVE